MYQLLRLPLCKRRRAAVGHSGMRIASAQSNRPRYACERGGILAGSLEGSHVLLHALTGSRAAEMAALKMGRGTTQLRGRLDGCLLRPQDEPPSMAEDTAGHQARQQPGCVCVASAAQPPWTAVPGSQDQRCHTLGTVASWPARAFVCARPVFRAVLCLAGKQSVGSRV